MFGSKKQAPEERPPADPNARTGIYGMAALYLAYLLYKIAWPYLTKDPYGPTTWQFLLGVLILGGGLIYLSILTWKMAHAPRPETPPLEKETGESEAETGGQEDEETP